MAGEVLPTYRDDRAAEDEFGRDSVERDEQWLAELGRRTVEMFVLSHLFSNRMEVRATSSPLSSCECSLHPANPLVALGSVAGTARTLQRRSDCAC